MRPSKFNVLVPNFPRTGEVLIFNTFSDSRLVINEQLKSVMDRAKGLTDLTVLTEEERSHLEALRDLGVMVDEDVDEDRELEYWFQRLKFDTATLDLTVLTTSACNLGCTYCFEEGINLKGFMKEETSLRVSAWAAQKLDEVRPRTLHLTLFGGEPLLNPEAAQLLSRSLYNLARARGIEQEISIITNGVLLTEQIVNDLTPLGLKRIKVTLDGDEAAHDSKRRYKNGKGSFQVIIKNLLAVKGKAPISIGGNFDDTTRESIPRLLDYLIARGFTPDDIMDMSFKPILSPTGSLPVLNNAMDSGHSCTFSDMKVSDIVWLHDEVEKRGFKNTIDGIALGPCCATREHTYTIDPWGKIYKCPALVGREEYIIGDVHESQTNYRNTQFMTVDLWRDSFCQPCAYRPICGGGCRGSSVSQSGNFEKIACEKPYFDNVAIELVKREYRMEQQIH
ncbi:MAG: SPASM domain-containing protein [Nitrospirae bacterium]|nr:SPASM domain-containing protein [Nitrospirota bacterium]